MQTITFNKQAIKQILKAPTINGKQVYYFQLNKYKDNYDSLLKAMYIYLRSVYKYNASDFIKLRAKIEKFPNWSLTDLTANTNLNEFQNLLKRILFIQAI